MLVVAAFAWLGVMAVVPIAVWHGVLSDTFGSFHWSVGYLVGEIAPWLLLAVGIAFLVPVAVSAGSHPDSRLYPRGRRAYIAWGTVLYLLGLLLAVQVGDLWSYAH